MRFTDIFIKRPVLATTVSLLILVLGLRSLDTLTIRQYPRTENAVVTISTFYYGADAETVAGFITQPLESAVAQAQGIDYLTSSSLNGISSITANLRLNYDANRALTEINTQVQSVLNQLPPETQQPTLKIDIGQTTDAMYLGFFSTVLPTNKITDYLLRVVKPKLDAVEGVQVAEILGGRQFALRAWLNADKMAAHNITGADVSKALVDNNFISALGSTKGQMVAVDLRASTNVHSLDEFKNLVIRTSNGALIRLGDIATVALGAEDYNTNVAFSGKTSVFIGIKSAPDANVLEVIERVKAVLPEIQKQMPEGLQSTIAYDTTKFITSSISEVIHTLVETLLIVTVVIFLFLGTFRAVAIPVIAMPLSLIGTFALMLAFGYSINLLTLLALVLAIGLVVDDAIIVVENVDRHLKEGETPFAAALAAARELAGPIIVISVVLVAVYVPVGFQGGLTGALFSEFAFTLAGAVGVSAVIALTLSPMMCSRMLRAHTGDNRLQKISDRTFDAVRGRYGKMLHYTLETWPVIVVLGALILAANAYLFMNSSKELAPNEDQGIVLAQSLAAPNATIQQMGLYSKQVYDIFKSMPEFDASFQIDGVPSTNQAFGGILFKPWDLRARTADVMQQELQAKLNTIAGARVAAFQSPPLPGARGLPFQFVINTTESFRNLDEVSQAVVAKAYQSGMFFYVDTDLKIDKP
ncbi:MAG: efflux RND transporter permease subunit, partial [Alphaproteobacteria bacterium]|nr:efflux RND transporter permease subunit [Alphaproteobacteria bacterium]